MPDNLPDLIEDATLAFHGEDHDAFRAAAARLAMPLIAEREKLAAELATTKTDLANERAVRAVQAGKLAEIRALCRTLEGIGIDPVTAKEVWAIIDRPMPEGGA